MNPRPCPAGAYLAGSALCRDRRPRLGGERRFAPQKPRRHYDDILEELLLLMATGHASSSNLAEDIGAVVDGGGLHNVESKGGGFGG